MRKSLIFSTFGWELAFNRCTEKKKEEFGHPLYLNKRFLFTLTKRIKCCRSPIILLHSALAVVTIWRVLLTPKVSWVVLTPTAHSPAPEICSPLPLVTARLQYGLPKYCRILSHRSEKSGAPCKEKRLGLHHRKGALLRAGNLAFTAIQGIKSSSFRSTEQNLR